MSSSTFPEFPGPASSTVDTTASASSTDSSSGDDGSGSTGGAANSSLYLCVVIPSFACAMYCACCRFSLWRLRYHFGFMLDFLGRVN